MMQNKITYAIRTNKRRKTYTIRVYDKGKVFAKYRTLPQGKEFRDNDYWTEADIRDFLKHSLSYYEVKRR